MPINISDIDLEDESGNHEGNLFFKNISLNLFININ